jgi:hypothetical protein
MTICISTAVRFSHEVAGIAGLCDAASAGNDTSSRTSNPKAAAALAVGIRRSNSQSSPALNFVSKASGLFSSSKAQQDPLLKQINGPAFGRACCVRTSSSAAPPSAQTQQVTPHVMSSLPHVAPPLTPMPLLPAMQIFTCCAVRASAALGACLHDASLFLAADTLSSVTFTMRAGSQSPPVCVRAWRSGSLFLCLCHPLVDAACFVLPSGELSRRLCDLDSLFCLAEQSGVILQP